MSVFARTTDLTRELAAKRVIKRFVDRFGLVYFGRTDHLEQQLMQGATAMGGRRDSHYAVGTFRGHDLAIAARASNIYYPGKTQRGYSWMIMQLDLQRDDLPHIFIDGNHHDEVFYNNLFIAYPGLENATRQFVLHDKLFLRHFKVFAPADQPDAAVYILRPEITAMLAHHFRQFDYEIAGDRLLVYATNVPTTPRLLPEMLRVGVWLADQLNKPTA